jgi:hypothetical protein
MNTQTNLKTRGGVIDMRNRKSIAVLMVLAFAMTLITAIGVSAQSASRAHPE